MNTHTNRLADQTSPYLQQHADNPVDWHPWGEEALERARREDKPILLSIGYSACHWCHVMAHESFEDEATARLMNEHFINIKVDREERPDLDKIYQTSHALLTQRSGGWPLTLFLTPQDHIAFFGGTYFPKEPRHGLPAFKEILRRVAEFLPAHRAEIEKQNASMAEALSGLYEQAAPTQALGTLALDQARGELAQSFDAQWGGFGRAPKFPHVTGLERLLRHWAGTRDEGREDTQALEMAVFSLRKMAQGGLYDQLGGGFCRYSVDDYWMIPHFEKMLYDNGPLLALCAQAWAATGEALFARVAKQTAEWIMREMQSPEGGYYSTLDADSEGEEGKFYVWNAKEVRGLLGETRYPVFAKSFGLDQTPNFEGRWHLHTHATPAELATGLGQEEASVRNLLDEARDLLFDVREQRIRPGCDEKILTAWNALAIRGMAVTAHHLEDPALLASAERALDFIRTTLFKDGRLLATYKDGKAHLSAYLDDYAYLIDALLELLQLRWRSEDLTFAQTLAEVVLNHFEDKQRGGFYFTANDHEPLIQRPRTLADEAMASGYGVVTYALARLGWLLGETRYTQAAERALAAASGNIEQAPSSHNSLLTAFEEQCFEPQVLILRGEGAALAHWHQKARHGYHPRRLCFAIPRDAGDLPPALAEKRPQGKAVAYVCQGPVCSAPLLDEASLEAALSTAPANG